jgi:TRAP-type uncharacterized transport system substrate-binding protein
VLALAHGSKLMVQSQIRKLEGLKGKKIGISSLGSASDLLFGYVLRKYGIDIFTQTRKRLSAFAADFF